MKRILWALLPHGFALLAGAVGFSYAAQHFEWASRWALSLFGLALALLGLRTW